MNQSSDYRYTANSETEQTIVTLYVQVFIQSHVAPNEIKRIQGEYYLWNSCLKDEIRECSSS
jgi:heme oxygenase